MPITYPITPPASPAPASARILGRPVVAVSESPFSLIQQVQEFVGQRWEIEVQLPKMMRVRADQWISFWLKLNGRRGSFYYSPPGGTSPKGIATGTPLVNGAAQVGNELATDGWTAGQAGILKAGDYIQVGTGSTSRLHMVIEDASSNGSGEATLLIWPSLRESPANDSAVVVSSPKGVWRMSGSEVPWDIDTALHVGLAFSAVEVI